MVETQIAYAVVGHRDRYRQALSLAKALSAPLSLDDGSLGSLANHDAAWRLAASQGREWCAVIEDDAVPVNGFIRAAEDALRWLPARGAICGYVGTTRPIPWRVGPAVRAAENSGSAWLRSTWLYWGPAVFLPTDLVLPMLEFVRGCDLPYDDRLGSYLHSIHVPVFYPYPSLVDHADGPSLISAPQAPRRAHRVGIPEWNTDFIEI